jgi:hypothetical protein
VKRFIVEMSVGFCAEVEIEAENRQEAIEAAKNMVLTKPSQYCEDAEINDINYVSEGIEI